jgi:hypothetical protein
MVSSAKFGNTMPFVSRLVLLLHQILLRPAYFASSEPCNVRSYLIYSLAAALFRARAQSSHFTELHASSECCATEITCREYNVYK